MRKFLVYSISRCGSTFAAGRLTRTVEFVGTEVCWHTDGRYIDWSIPIHHTHNFDMLKQAPDDFVRIHMTRSLIESTISRLVAEYTRVYNVFGDKDREEYLLTWQNKKIKVDIEQLKTYLVFGYQGLQQTNRFWLQLNVEKYQFDYDSCTKNINLFYKTLGLTELGNNSGYDDSGLTQKLPIDKFALIENLQEVIVAIKSVPIEFDQRDKISIEKIQKYLQQENS